MRHARALCAIVLSFCFILACGQNSDQGERLNVYDQVSGALDPGVPGDPCVENGAKTACYFGPAGTSGVGQCKAGTQWCIAGKYTECKGQVTPDAQEVCDGVDDDCDGTVDEDLGSTTCGTGGCQTTVANCVAGEPTDCEFEALLKAAPETCDGVDNDCNGLVDDDQTGATLTQTCYSGAAGTAGVGLCKSGTQTCTDGSFGTCVGEVTPSADICNSADDDCDGTVDEDFPNLGSACTVGTGACQQTGAVLCNSAGSGEVCSVSAGDPQPETCNGNDDDCDGMMDEDLAGNTLTQSCYSGAAGTAGVGLCKAGTQTCVAGAFGACGGEVTPVVEACNGSDDDCDGSADEAATGGALTQTCYSGADGTAGVGQCVAGTQECCGGSFGACEGEKAPSAEACSNSVDDDCDGVVDTDCAISCTDADGDTFGVGCSAGSDCDDTSGAVNRDEPEWCGNTTDDDCDGSTDELNCFSAATGSVLVVFKETGECVYENLYLTYDFKGPSKATFAQFVTFDGFSAAQVNLAVGGGKDGLHRLNLEFDTNGDLGDELMYVDGSLGSAVLNDQCGTVRVFYAGLEQTLVALMDPRFLLSPFGPANLFVCFGSNASCYLCGGDWDADGTADCTEGADYCAGNPADKDVCGL